VIYKLGLLQRPCSFAAALLASLLKSQIFAWSMVNKLAYVVLILALLWAILVYAYFYTKKRLSSAIAIKFTMLLMML
jgi:membrane protease YdiL (CAAX protease family)